MQDKSFINSIRGKIIVAFLISLIALIGSYVVNKMAFGEIHESVENLSNPGRKLIAVNGIFLEMNESEKSFRNLVINDQSFKSFITHSENMKLFSDSLRLLCHDNYYQVKLIDSISKFLDIREQLLLNYVEFRRALKSNNNIFKQTKLLDSIISVQRAKVDSVVFINEQKNTTTRIDSVAVNRESEKKGFFRKLFGAAKKEPEKMQQIIQRETNVQTDTIIHLKKDEISAEVQQIISDIEKEQNIRRKRFFNRETELAAFENSFNNKITSLLSEVQKDIIHQTGLTNSQAEESINRSSIRIYVIIAAFFLFAAILFVLMLTDVTKSNKYRQLLERAKEEAEFHSLSRQRFLSNMSHEIRTPLQSIIGYSEQINEQQQPDKNYIDAIQHSSKHLLHVINEILDYDSINSGKFIFEKKDFEIRQTVSDVISILSFQANKKGIELKCNQITENQINGDAHRLKQILLNLVGNAIKFTDKGYVSLDVQHQITGNKENYIFKVQDTGIGIPFDMQDKIFEQFEQINLPFEQRYKGTGLGLSIVKALVEGQGGHIEVESEPDKGACFTFRIAYDKAVNPVAITDSVALPQSAYSGNVWLVDDDNLILQLCSDILKKHGIRYTAFHSAEALMNYDAGEMPDIILVDIRMPGMNGIQLFDNIRKKYGTSVKVIALTAQALPEERAEILAHGFNDILLKPFKESDLMSLFHVSTANAPITNTRQPFRFLNTTALENMLSGNKDDLISILQQYKTDTAEDMLSVETCLSGDTSELSLLLHRLSGRTSQIGSKELGMQLRKLEIETHNTPEFVNKKKIEHVLTDVKFLLKEIEEKISILGS
ncbi:response regulator [Taibaiella lutea]|uniref:histidine kinase n=1 Tax=Taibaiella lutea TaxID=2608001 RepID=A0A5M6CBE0_9BACT|nr:ATP-binding protein [Taibaiella lutea]KAA5532454.1 response regulator [Taibaiella lutea]